MAMFILTVFFLCSISAGLFLFLKPASAIELQKKFYEKINWRIEPISMAKEIRNTRRMGLFLVVISVITTFCFFKALTLCRVLRG